MSAGEPASSVASSNGGVDQCAIHASFIETAKLNAIDPQADITSIVSCIVDGYPQSQIDQLVDWNYRT